MNDSRSDASGSKNVVPPIVTGITRCYLLSSDGNAVDGISLFAYNYYMSL